MLPNASDAYLETQVFTATPQRLRLMLIEGAIRRVNAAQLAASEGNPLQANAEVGRCRDIVAELMSSIDAQQSPLNQQIFSVYLFLYSSLIEIPMANDFGRLAGILRILEEERQTWREVCEKMPDRPAPDAALPSAEELAPSRVAESTFTAGYVPAPNLFNRGQRHSRWTRKRICLASGKTRNLTAVAVRRPFIFPALLNEGEIQ